MLLDMQLGLNPHTAIDMRTNNSKYRVMENGNVWISFHIEEF